MCVLIVFSIKSEELPNTHIVGWNSEDPAEKGKNLMFNRVIN